MANVIRLTPDSGGEWDRPILDPPKTPADADVLPESIGQDLSEARQRSGKTLMDVWRETKIPPHHLIAIETSRFEDLPGRVYAIGFVRSYSAYLGLDAETFVARLRAEMAGPDAKLPDIGPLPLPERKDPEAEFTESGDAEESFIGLLSPPERKLPHNVIAGLLIAVLIYSGYYVLGSDRRMAQPPPVIPVPARLAAEAGLTQQQLVARPLAPVEQASRTSTEPALAPSTDAAPAPPLSVQPFATVDPAPASPTEPALARPTDVALTPPVSVRPRPTVGPAPAPPTDVALTPPVSVRHRPTVGPAPALSPKLALLPPPDAAPTQPVAVPAESASRFHAPLPLGQRYGMGNTDSRIILRVHRSIRLAVQGTGNRIFIDRILDAGDTYRVPNMVGLKLSAPDAGAIEVILDDTTVGFAGKDGVMARDLSLEPQSIIDRKQHG